MRKGLTNFFWNIEVWAVQKHANLVDLVKSFPTNILLQNLASIQERTSPLKFAHLAEKSEWTFQLSVQRAQRRSPGEKASARVSTPRAKACFCCGVWEPRTGKRIHENTNNPLGTAAIKLTWRFGEDTGYRSESASAWLTQSQHRGTHGYVAGSCWVVTEKFNR